MTDAQSIANRYIDLWNERDAKRRLDMLTSNWTADARYTCLLYTSDAADE